MNFKTRSYQAELLDNEDIPTADLYQNLRELDFINHYLGGHSVILDGIKYFINSKQIINIVNLNKKEFSEQLRQTINSKQTNYLNISDKNIFSNNSEILKIYEIGSGGGDNLRAVSSFLIKKISRTYLGE